MMSWREAQSYPMTLRTILRYVNMNNIDFIRIQNVDDNRSIGLFFSIEDIDNFVLDSFFVYKIEVTSDMNGNYLLIEVERAD